MSYQVRVPQTLTIAGGLEGHTEKLLRQPALPRGPSPIQRMQSLTLALCTLDHYLPLQLASVLETFICLYPSSRS